MELSQRQQEILDIAEEHGGTFHLPRRFHAPKKWEAETATDRDYAACQSLVNKRLACWHPRHPAIITTPRGSS